MGPFPQRLSEAKLAVSAYRPQRRATVETDIPMSSPAIRKAVIPAAGRGTRLFPATKVIPKEMMPVGGRPVIQFAVEEALASGIKTVILVLCKGKEVVAEHFQPDAFVEHSIAQQGSMGGAAEALGRVSTLVQVRTVWQQSPLGLADAIRAARAMVRDEPFAVILPDALIDSAVPCTRQLMSCYAKNRGCIIATRLVDSCDVGRFGILDVASTQDRANGNGAMRVKALIERPQPGTITSRHGIFGRYILEPEIFDSIERTEPGLNAELQLTDALMAHTATAAVYGCDFEGKHYDVGSREGFIEASIAYALKDAQIASMIRKRFGSEAYAATTTSVAGTGTRSEGA